MHQTLDPDCTMDSTQFPLTLKGNIDFHEQFTNQVDLCVRESKVVAIYGPVVPLEFCHEGVGPHVHHSYTSQIQTHPCHHQHLEHKATVIASRM